MKKFLLLLTAVLVAAVTHAGEVNYGNPKLGSTLATNPPFAGAILKSDGTMNYWGTVPSTPTNWALYPAVTNLDMGGYSITNIKVDSIIFQDGTAIGTNQVGEWNSVVSRTNASDYNNDSTIHANTIKDSLDKLNYDKVNTNHGGNISIVGNLSILSGIYIPSVWNPIGINGVWYGSDISSDGAYRTAVNATSLWLSANYGTNWNTPEVTNRLLDVAISSNGQYQSALGFSHIYVSSNYGETWTQRDSKRAWTKIAMSKSGLYQTAVGSALGIYVSTNYGLIWSSKSTVALRTGIAVSHDGKYQVATRTDGQFQLSTDYGATWSLKSIASSWYGPSLSIDGQYQLVANTNNGGTIYVSTNYGIDWTSVILNKPVRSTAMIGDGSVMLAGSYESSYILRSDDFGVTWFETGDVNTWKDINITPNGQYIFSTFAYSNDVYQIETINGDGNITVANGINLGGVTRTNWPEAGGSTNLSTYNNDAGFITNLFTSGGGRLFVTEDGPTSMLWHVTSGGHTNKLITSYSD